MYKIKFTTDLTFFDLNKFKPINDQFGHAEGDIALITFSSLLLNAFRDSDVIARLGGDEFVMLLANSDEAGTKKVLERLEALVTKENLLQHVATLFLIVQA